MNQLYQPSNSPEGQQHNLESVECQAWLNVPIAELGLSEGYISAFNRDKLTTCRDLYVVGRERLVSMGILNEENLTTIEHALADAPAGLTFMNKPMARDIAQFCPDLQAVSGMALGVGPFMRLTVGEAWDARTNLRIVRRLSQYYASFPESCSQLMDIQYAKLRRFVTEFTEARQQFS